MPIQKIGQLLIIFSSRFCRNKLVLLISIFGRTIYLLVSVFVPYRELASFFRMNNFFRGSWAKENEIESFITNINSGYVPQDKAIELINQIHEIKIRICIPGSAIRLYQKNRTKTKNRWPNQRSRFHTSSQECKSKNDKWMYQVKWKAQQTWSVCSGCQQTCKVCNDC